MTDDQLLDHPYKLAGHRIDPVAGHLSQGGEQTRLSRKQLEVLAILASADGDVVSREAFIDQVWDGNALVGGRGLTDIIYSLRRLLEDPSGGPLIRTIPRRGYQLMAEVKVLGDRRDAPLAEHPSSAVEPDSGPARELEASSGAQRSEPSGRRASERSRAEGTQAAEQEEIEPTRVETWSAMARRRSRAAIGETIGPYRLLDVLGEGGMGTVYLAEQREPVERTVALKLIRAGMDSDQVLARFEAECQALALMDHAHVAAVYDAGCTDTGHPYFAMEYVPGLAITSHCDRLKLGLRARIELFLQVCHGVQHAHQKGLIHRDLKPSNLLVKAQSRQSATVKIIDFGVAKSLQRKLSARPAHTRLGTFVGTPSYSSPEQISGRLLEVDTRTDVYSLGVVLYELLAGVTPFSSDELAGKSQLELVELLSDSDPPTPLARFTDLSRDSWQEIAENRSQSVEDLKQSLSTDLAWITLKCLERNPEDRYPSVLELIKDLERWLEDRPIEARPASRVYRLRKLVRRHRAAAALVSGVTLLVLAALALAVFGLMRAEREADKARAAARQAQLAADFQVDQLQDIDPATMALGLRSRLLDQLRDEMAGSGAQPADIEQAEQQMDSLLRNINLVDLTLDLLDGHFFEPAIESVAEKYTDYPELQALLWQSIADTLVELGHFRRAEPVQQQALEKRLDLLGEDHPLTLESTLHRGILRSSLGQLEQARADMETAIEGFRLQLGEHDPRTLAARESLGQLLLHLYAWQPARQHFTDVLEARRRLLGEDHPDTLSTLNNLAVLDYWTENLESSERYFSAALDGMRRVLGDKDPRTLGVLTQASSVYAELGDLERAIAMMQEAVDGLRAQLGDAHPKTLSAQNDYAVLLTKNRDFELAETLLRQVAESQRRSIGTDSTSTMTTVGNLGRVLVATGQLDEAEELLREALEVFQRKLGPEHRRTQFFLYHLAKLLRDKGRLDDAEQAFLQIVDSQAELGPDHPRRLYILNDLARVRMLKGQLEPAESLLRETLEKQEKIQGAEHPETLRAQSYLAEISLRQGRVAEAEERLRAALELQKKEPGLENEETLFTMNLLAETLRARGELEEALALGEQATRIAAGFYHRDDHRLALIEMGYGRTLSQLGRTREAEAVLRRARASLEASGLR